MTGKPFDITRRGLGLGLAGTVLAGTGLAAPHALAAPQAVAAAGLRFPLSLAYARIGAAGLVSIRPAEQTEWSALQTRMGALIDRIEPVQPRSLMGTHAPETDGGASCILAARKLAADAGFEFVAVYSTHDGRRTYQAYNNWLSRAFVTLHSDYGPYSRATGEAHLLDVGGGAPLASVSADAPTRKWTNPLDNHRNPEREALTALTQGIERRLHQLARPAYAAQRSIAD